MSLWTPALTNGLSGSIKEMVYEYKGGFLERMTQVLDGRLSGEIQTTTRRRLDGARGWSRSSTGPAAPPNGAGYCPAAAKLAVPNSSPAAKTGLPPAKASLNICAVWASRPSGAFESEMVRLLGSEERDPAPMAKTPIRPSLPGKDGVGSTSTSAVVALAPRSSQYSLWKTWPAPSWSSSIAPPVRSVPSEASGASWPPAAIGR